MKLLTPQVLNDACETIAATLSSAYPGRAWMVRPEALTSRETDPIIHASTPLSPSEAKVLAGDVRELANPGHCMSRYAIRTIVGVRPAETQFDLPVEHIAREMVDAFRVLRQFDPKPPSGPAEPMDASDGKEATVGLTYAQALTAMQRGRRVLREGWNGKGMWIGLVKSWEQLSLPYNDQWPGHELLPFIAMKTADNKLAPWHASQTDMLSDDWEIFDPASVKG